MAAAAGPPLTPQPIQQLGRDGLLHAIGWGAIVATEIPPTVLSDLDTYRSS